MCVDRTMSNRASPGMIGTHQLRHYLVVSKQTLGATPLRERHVQILAGAHRSCLEDRRERVPHTRIHPVIREAHRYTLVQRLQNVDLRGRIEDGGLLRAKRKNGRVRSTGSADRAALRVLEHDECCDL